jgi:hypothetical protein
VKCLLSFDFLNASIQGCYAGSFPGSYLRCPQFENAPVLRSSLLCLIFVHESCFVGLAYYQGKDIVFRFIIEYSSLRDFGPQVIIIGLFLYEDV